MKKFLLSAVALLAAIQLTAAPVDPQTAQAAAQRFMQQKAQRGELKGSAGEQMTLAHAEMNSKMHDRAVYYVFNTKSSFVIVSGDDRAQQILAYGDSPIENLNSIPENMRFWLEQYKAQLEQLQLRPNLAQAKPMMRAATVVEPLLEAKWNQGDPYYGQCPMDGDRRSQTGCAATSLAQVFYKWKYPTDATPVVPGYTTRTRGFALEALPSVTFDWSNMLPEYTIFSPAASKAAVAQLMRYIGQAEQMDYTNEGSEAWEEDVLRACKLFGYNDAHITYKSFLDNNYVETVYINDEDWNVILQEELAAGRPVVYCAYGYSTAYEGYYGHAFNVDGVDAEGNYHINWGWSGTGNGHFALNAFSNQGSTYNIGQLMVMGIEPPAPLDAPVMQPTDTTRVSATSFTAQWTAVEGAATYTLEVYEAGSGEQPPTGVYENVFAETFPYCQSNSSSAISKIDNYCTNKGWTGSNVFEAKGGLRIGSTRAGYLTTPGLDMTQSGGKMTVKAVIKPYSTDTDVPVRVSCGNSIAEVTVSTEGTYTIVLDCEETEGQKVTFANVTEGKRFVITQLDIYSSVEGAAGLLLRVPVEEGDDVSRLINGIETTTYTVTGLLTGDYEYRVKAVSATGTESPWSNVEAVTLREGAHAYAAGDVNHDGDVNITDVTLLIARVLNEASGTVCEICADFNGDGSVNITDITLLISMVMSSN